MTEYPMGLTVKQLKDIIKDWPEEDHMGEDSEVFLCTGVNRSGPVTTVENLNGTDILFGWNMSELNA